MTHNNETAGELEPSGGRANEVQASAPADPWAAFWRRLAELFEEQAGGES
ncbi:hypothetical protein MUK60_10160 [Streptomyces sp. LRE541]|nr:hypothetical protein [Streptomyces sp. LRE541]UPZ28148.1 hypothetical protein MUK60_10160 [Streptomyces sp. LRE541]